MDITNRLSGEVLERTSFLMSFDNDYIDLIDEIMNEGRYTLRLPCLSGTDHPGNPRSVLLALLPGEAQWGDQRRLRLPSRSPFEMANRQSLIYGLSMHNGFF